MPQPTSNLMNIRLERVRLMAVAAAVSLLANYPGSSAASDALGKLEYVNSISNKALRQVTSIVISPDGKHAYAAAYAANALTVYERDQTNGQLTLIQTIADTKDFRSALNLRLSDDG